VQISHSSRRSSRPQRPQSQPACPGWLVSSCSHPWSGSCPRQMPSSFSCNCLRSWHALAAAGAVAAAFAWRRRMPGSCCDHRPRRQLQSWRQVQRRGGWAALAAAPPLCQSQVKETAAAQQQVHASADGLELPCCTAPFMPDSPPILGCDHRRVLPATPAPPPSFHHGRTSPASSAPFLCGAGAASQPWQVPLGRVAAFLRATRLVPPLLLEAAAEQQLATERGLQGRWGEAGATGSARGCWSC
jgi:hypothetical protein